MQNRRKRTVLQTKGAFVQLDLDVAIVSLFCAGGLFAYVREALRLHRLQSAGKVAPAKILNKEMDDSGSESIVHYIVTYEFVDEQGNTLVHEHGLNSRKFFSNLAIGETIEILYCSNRAGNSYPISQIKSDQRLSCYIAGAILIFWAVMVLFFIYS